MAGTFTKLKGVPKVGEMLLSNQIETNLISFFNYGLLEAGGFYNVRMPQSGAYGGTFDTLRLVDDPNYSTGQVWEGFRGEWVWESGLDLSTQPIRVSGVYVDNTFRPASGVGTYAHTVNYPLGRIVFDSAISSSATVKAEFSHRWATFTTVDSPWFRQVLDSSFRVDNPHFAQFGSGSWDQLGTTRINLPAVAVEVSKVTLSPFALGGGQKVNAQVSFHILAETSWDRNQLKDILINQNNRNIYFFDVNDIPEHRFPLDVNGSPTPSGFMYPQMVNIYESGGFRWRKAFLEESTGFNIPIENYFGAQVVTNFEVEMYEL